jgi:hypothetical protein
MRAVFDVDRKEQCTRKIENTELEGQDCDADAQISNRAQFCVRISRYTTLRRLALSPKINQYEACCMQLAVTRPTFLCITTQQFESLLASLAQADVLELSIACAPASIIAACGEFTPSNPPKGGRADYEGLSRSLDSASDRDAEPLEPLQHLQN